MTVERIDPRETYEHVDNEALLVCAYDDNQQFEENQLEGAISLDQLKSRESTLPKNKEIIFYCHCPNDEASNQKAEEYRGKGFENVKVLEGGVEAWKEAGFAATV